MISNLVEVYCLVSNLTKKIDQNIKKNNVGRKGILSRADYITMAIIKQERCIRTNKDLYQLIKYCMKRDFPVMPSYQQFCEGLESSFMYLAIIGQVLAQMNRSQEEDEYIVDASAMPICKTIYANQACLGEGLADYGKNLEGWFFGFKIHLIININMEVVSFKFSPASTSDIAALDEKMVSGLKGFLIGDKGYISSKKTALFLKNGLHLITRPRKNMKKSPVTKRFLSLLSKRQRVETVFGQLKDNFMFICRKVRSVQSFFAHACAALVAYMLKQKPALLSIDFDVLENFSIS
jgi:hypothetical protein